MTTDVSAHWKGKKPTSEAPLAAPDGSALDAHTPRMEAEAELMTAAMEFGRIWGQNQREHPKSYWLEVHLERWNRLARAAVAYTATLEPNEKGQQRR